MWCVKLCNPCWRSRFQITCSSALLLLLASFCLETVAMRALMCVQCPTAANHCGKNCSSPSIPLEFCTLVELLWFQVEAKKKLEERNPAVPKLRIQDVFCFSRSECALVVIPLCSLSGKIVVSNSFARWLSFSLLTGLSLLWNTLIQFLSYVLTFSSLTMCVVVKTVAGHPLQAFYLFILNHSLPLQRWMWLWCGQGRKDGHEVQWPLSCCMKWEHTGRC